MSIGCSSPPLKFGDFTDLDFYKMLSYVNGCLPTDFAKIGIFLQPMLIWNIISSPTKDEVTSLFVFMLQYFNSSNG